MKNLEPKYIRNLNRELDYERRGKMIFKTATYILLSIVVVGPSLLLVLLNADFIDRVFSLWYVQFGFFIVILVITIYLYLRWKLRN